MQQNYSYPSYVLTLEYLLLCVEKDSVNFKEGAGGNSLLVFINTQLW